MVLLSGRERVFRARVEMVVNLLAENSQSALGALAQAMDIHPSYLCRFLRDLEEIGLVKKAARGKYSLDVPVGEFPWHWLRLPRLQSPPAFISYHRLCGDLEFRWSERSESHEPSWPWGDYIERAAKRWSPSMLEKRSRWNLLKNRLLRAYRKVASRVRRS